MLVLFKKLKHKNKEKYQSFYSCNNQNQASIVNTSWQNLDLKSLKEPKNCRFDAGVDHCLPEDSPMFKSKKTVST